MKLYTSTTSPYSRIVMLGALARGMDDLQLVFADPWATPDALVAVNPLSQVPALVTDGGAVITNSAFIIDFLFGCPWREAAQAATAGYAYELLDQVVKAYSLERFRLADAPAHPHIERARAAVARGLAHAPQLQAGSDAIEQHALGMALSYAHLRHPALWPHLPEANRLAFAQYEQRPDVRAVAIAQLEKHPASIGALRLGAIE